MMMPYYDGDSSYMLTCLKELASALRCSSREVLREAGRQVLWTVEDMVEVMVGDMGEDMVGDMVGLWTVEVVGLSVGGTVPLHWKGGAEGVHWVKETHMCTHVQCTCVHFIRICQMHGGFTQTSLF